MKRGGRERDGRPTLRLVLHDDAVMRMLCARMNLSISFVFRACFWLGDTGRTYIRIVRKAVGLGPIPCNTGR